MLVEMFVNELSQEPSTWSISAAQKCAIEFVETIRVAATHGVNRVLRMSEEFHSRPISKGYYWQDWLSDKNVEREFRQYFLSLATKAPYLSDLPEIEAAWKGLDCYWENQATLGLKAAYVSDGLAVSMSSSAVWDKCELLCRVDELSDCGEIFSRQEPIHHASKPNHVAQHLPWINLRNRQAVGNGRELWNLSSTFFPKIIWGCDVERQMNALPEGSLSSIVRGLTSLNRFCNEWQSGSFDAKRIACNVSPESSQTLANYGKERTFNCPGGTRRVFNWHVKTGFWRIYFDPSVGPGQLLVGYVGKHLPTVTFQ